MTETKQTIKNSITVQNVSLSRKKHKILQDVSFDVMKGGVVSILGPNGAGKTTLIRILTTALQVDQGTVTVLKKDITKNQLDIKKEIGITPQENNLYEALTAKDNLMHHGQLFGMPKLQIKKRIDEVLEQVDLLDRKKDSVQKFSGGMKRRLAIARSIMHKPKILFLDEPTTGLDPRARQSIWTMLKELKTKTNASILLTSHYMEEAEFLSDHVIILNKGVVIAQGSPQELREIEIGEAIIELMDVPESQHKLVHEHFPENRYFKTNKLFQIPLKDFVQIPDTIQKIKDYKIEYKDIITRKTTLEDVYFKLTGTILN